MNIYSMDNSEDILKRILESNTKLYGEIQDCCGIHKNFCRCNAVKTEVVLFLSDKLKYLNDKDILSKK